MSKILSYFKNFVADNAATVTVLAALSLPIILGMTGVGIDASSWMMTKRNLQTASDAAAMAGAWEIANGYDSQAEYVAAQEAQKNGYDPDMGGTLTLIVSTDADGQNIVSANLSQRANVYFAGIFLDDSVYTATSASAAVIEPGGSYCILALDETADA